MELTLTCPETPHKYAAANVCIYCGASEEATQLTNEHIFPKGLGGKLELPKSSCNPCAAKTGAVEQKLLRGPLWPVRVRAGIHSGRRRGEQPTDFDVEFWQSERRDLVSVPIDEMSVNLVMPAVGPPGLLVGGHWDDAYERTHTDIFSFDPGGFDANGNIQSKYLKPGSSGITLHGSVDMLVFRRMIAKIAHGYAWAELGPIFRPLLIDLILGRDVRDAGQLVGGFHSLKNKEVSTRHGVGLYQQPVDGKRLIVAAVSIFLPVTGTVFLAVVGEMNDRVI